MRFVFQIFRPDLIASLCWVRAVCLFFISRRFCWLGDIILTALGACLSLMSLPPTACKHRVAIMSSSQCYEEKQFRVCIHLNAVTPSCCVNSRLNVLPLYWMKLMARFYKQPHLNPLQNEDSFMKSHVSASICYNKNG